MFGFPTKVRETDWKPSRILLTIRVFSIDAQSSEMTLGFFFERPATVISGTI